MEEDVRLTNFIQSRLEGFDELSGQFSDESDRIREQKGQVADHDFSHGRVQGGEQFILGKNFRFSQRIHEGGLAHVGIAHEGGPNQRAAVAPLRGHLAVDFNQFFSEQRNFLLDDSTVRFNLRFTGSAHADAAFLALKVRPHAGQSGQQVFVLGQFHLGARVGGLSTRSKNVENQVGSVHDFDLEQALNILELGGRQFVVKNGQIHPVVVDVFFDFLHFTAAQKGARIGSIQFLGKNLQGFRAGRVGQKAQFLQVFCRFCLGLFAGNGTN